MKSKVAKIIIFSILAVLAIVYTVLYVLYPDATKQITKTVLFYICEKPLPVIGISLLAFGILVYKLIQVTGIGNKSLKECKNHLAESKELNEMTHAELLAFEEAVDKKIDEFIANFMAEHKDNMKQICSAIPNKNVKELGERLYGEKENSETTVD